MKRRKRTFSSPPIVAVTLAALIVIGLVILRPILGQDSRILITEPIDESKLVSLPGNTRPEARIRQNDRGAVPDSFAMDYMMLQLKRAPSLELELRSYIEQLTDKSSPNFHKWLSPDQIGQQYGMAQQDLNTIANWLASHGFTVSHIYPATMVVAFSGTAGMIRDAFHTEIHYLEAGGQTHYANMSDPRIPTALAPAVAGIVSMHNFLPRPAYKPALTVTAAANGDTYYLLGPADVQTIYSLNPVYRQGIYGHGQTIVVLEDVNPYKTDWQTFQTTFGLTKYGGTSTTVHPGGCGNPSSSSAEGEANLDVQYALAMAPGASVEAATCADTSTFGGLIALENLVNAGSPPAIMSMSYGECEAGNGATANLAFYNAYQSAAAAGVSVFVSAGDEGAVSCSPDTTYGRYGIGVSGFASTPYNVAVGGTDFEDGYLGTYSTYWSSTNLSTYGSAKSYIPEIPWNGSCAGWLLSNKEGSSVPAFCQTSTGKNDYDTTGSGSGGPSGCATGSTTTGDTVSGTCAGWPKPSWQSGISGNPADGVRDLPDVSLFASNGLWAHFLVYCWSDTSTYSPATYGTAACTTPPNPLASTPAFSGAGGTSFATPMMAGIQALVNQKWGTTWQGSSPRSGNPNPIYYAIANTQFNSSTATNCYSINQPGGRRGLGPTCTFYDVTQGDMDLNCRTNTNNAYCEGTGGSTTAYGALSTQPLSSVKVLTGGSGYTSAPSCALGAPANINKYLNPSGGTIWGGGTQATCTATISGGAVTLITLNNPGDGYAGGSGCTLTGGGATTAATCVAVVAAGTGTGTASPTTLEPAFGATPGWDFATGVGTVNAYNLVFNTAW